MYDIQDRHAPNMRKDDRIIVLAPIEGKKVVSSTGLVDTRLFNGDNKLHAVLGVNGLWSCRYEQGSVPGALKQSFTKFSELLRYVEQYFLKRNIKVVEVQD